MAKAAKAYGKLSQDEWLKLSNEAAKPVEIEEAMREDYEIGVDKDGCFDVSYRASCQDCQFVFTFKHKVKDVTIMGCEKEKRC